MFDSQTLYLEFTDVIVKIAQFVHFAAFYS